MSNAASVNLEIRIEREARDGNISIAAAGPITTIV
jgi:hypothetical protein